MSAPTEPTELVEAGPGLRERIDRVSLLARRQRWGILALVALLALIVGVFVGRATATGPEADARRAVETALLPLALDADGIWTSTSDGRLPVSEAVIALRSDGDAQPTRDNHAGWLDAYDAALVRMAGLDLPATARPVQRQFMAALTLSRDAVEVLGHAARVEDPDLRRDLTTEVGRLRQRSEQLTQAARASTADLDGRRADVSPLPRVTGFLEGRRG